MSPFIKRYSLQVHYKEQNVQNKIQKSEKQRDIARKRTKSVLYIEKTTEFGDFQILDSALYSSCEFVKENNLVKKGQEVLFMKS